MKTIVIEKPSLYTYSDNFSCENIKNSCKNINFQKNNTVAILVFWLIVAILVFWLVDWRMCSINISLTSAALASSFYYFYFFIYLFIFFGLPIRKF